MGLTKAQQARWQALYECMLALEKALTLLASNPAIPMDDARVASVRDEIKALQAEMDSIR